MNRVGLVIDMSHSADRSTLEAIELSTRPIAITHANPHWWHAALRNKSDEVIRALTAKGGMLGFSLYPHHLKDGSNCTLDSFCAPGFPDMPDWFQDNRHFDNIQTGLAQAGLSETEVAGIMGDNWLRFYDQNFGPA